jgi:Fur family ferric uptake transcriptional regulator
MSVDELLIKVKEAGGRLTKVRQAVLDCLSTAEQPVSALAITNYLATLGLKVNRTTIYRELIFLTKHELVEKIRLVGQGPLFELSGQHRHHLICLKCQSVEAVNLEDNLTAQEQKITKTKKFKILSHALEFYGLCHKCSN